MFGLFNINKPAGITSHAVVAHVRRLLDRGIKVGHAGTLDPFATGVLVLCVGPATRLAEYVRNAPKRYRAKITLGAVSTTDDPEGQITSHPAASPPDEEQITQTLRQFTGPISQVPPAHSAVHYRGRRAYQLARIGKPPDLPARTVEIHDIKLLSYDWPELVIDIYCGAGTYIRSLARDIGRALGIGGYCCGLTRTAVGDFTLDRTVSLDKLNPSRDIISPLAAVESLAKITLDDNQFTKLANGQSVQADIPQYNKPHEAKPELAILNHQGNLTALGRYDLSNKTILPTKVFSR